VLSKDTFIDDDLQEHFSDLLYRVRLYDQRDAYVYILLEHKSYPDPLVAAQLLRYMVRIWNAAMRLPRTKSLPPIIPVVLYHGDSRWNIAPNFGALVAAAEELRLYIPEFRYELVDLSAYLDDDIKGAVMARVGLLILKHIFDPDLAQRLPDILALLRVLTSQKTGIDYLYTVLRYVAQASKIVNSEDLKNALEAAFPTEGENVMPTLARQWMEEGIQEGRQQGLQQGLQQGERRGLLAAIEFGLEVKFGSEGLHLMPEITRLEDVNTLRLIFDAIKVAEGLDAFMTWYQVQSKLYPARADDASN
jgi:predicted transposase/invertase (TIGR01784 family)